MSLGPITIFDKSALQCLNLDEACWFNNFYMANITPLFFVETLADLRKEMAKGRTPEDVVGNLAEKTPPGGTPNVHHRELCIAELMGHPIEMRGVPHVGGGRPVDTGRQRGLMYEPAAEMRAFQRWQEGRFLDVEYQFAGGWRLALRRRTSLDVVDWLRQMGGFHLKPRDFQEAKAFAERAVLGSRHRYALIKAACLTLEAPSFFQSEIVKRWKAEGGPPFHEFAPYTAHVLTIDAFFYIAILAHLISPDRPSNRVDMAYLYYLPFCMVFVSCDKLHEKTVPLFLNSDQVFVRGSDLKTDLARLDEHYSGLPAEVQERGVMVFAKDPPEDTTFLTTRLWDRFLPKWREIVKDRRPPDPKEDALLLGHVKNITEAPRGEPGMASGLGEPDFITFERSIPVRMGKWRLVPPEAEQPG